jgi:glyoxylase-like metal-dependent hydrolase (beta-lactamase superfamily II)
VVAVPSIARTPGPVHPCVAGPAALAVCRPAGPVDNGVPWGPGGGRAATRRFAPADRPYDRTMTDVGDRSAARALDAVTTRVRAANPSPMTLTGTNTYIVGAAGGALAVVDPGPRLPAHRAAIDAAVAGRGGRVAVVVITHHHADHAEAVGWADDWSVPALAFDPARVPGTDPLADGQPVPVAGVDLIAHHLPGHCSDHLCLELRDTGVVLTGDHVLGEGTTVIYWPDGDLTEYLTSLRSLRGLGARALYPGHGEVVDDPTDRVDALLAHRAERTEQILEALAAGRETVAAIVERVYPDLPPALRPAAGRSVSAHLTALERDGRVAREQERWRGA